MSAPATATEGALRQIDAFITPGSLLKAARESRGMTEREAADRLHLMPDYVAIIERDDYQALRSPSFARGYVKAYGRLMGLDEAHLLSVYDEFGGASLDALPKRIETRPLQLQHTGAGVVIGLVVLGLLVAVLWWMRGSNTEKPKWRTEQAPAVMPSSDFGQIEERATR